MRQNITENIPGLTVLAGKAFNGATLHGADIQLKQNTASAIGADRTALVSSNTAYVTGKDESASAYAVKFSIMKPAHAFVELTLDLWKPSLGKRYSQAWDALGFRNSLI